MQRKICLILLAGMLVFVTACSGGGDPASTASDTPDSAAGASAGMKVDSSTAGNISGKVTYSGEASQGARIRMNADPSCADQHSSATYTEDLVVADGNLKNAFVWVKSGLDGYTFDPPSGSISLDQKGCLYSPHVLGVRTGQEISIMNSDPTTHNINPSPKNNRNWNISQGPSSAARVQTFAREEVMILVKCNVHPWMTAYVGVVAHPYFAVTADDGSFALNGLPPGSYTVEVWHERLGTQEQQVTIAASESTEVSFEFGG
jgi:hypothetical protein